MPTIFDNTGQEVERTTTVGALLAARGSNAHSAQVTAESAAESAAAEAAGIEMIVCRSAFVEPVREGTSKVFADSRTRKYRSWATWVSFLISPPGMAAFVPLARPPMRPCCYGINFGALKMPARLLLSASSFLESERLPRHARAYGDIKSLRQQIVDERVTALTAYRADVAANTYPAVGENASIDADELAQLVDRMGGSNGVSN